LCKQAALAKETKTHEALKNKHRKLEQQNDDLESKERQIEGAMESTENNLEEMIEAKVMAEQELEELAQEAQTKEQRLRDEIQELSSELTVTKAKLTPRPGMPGTPNFGTPVPFTPGSVAASPLSTKGLAVIGDMLQRVKDMEDRLAGCRSSLGTMINERHSAPNSPAPKSPDVG